jgi:hypothetical protein
VHLELELFKKAQAKQPTAASVGMRGGGGATFLFHEFLPALHMSYLSIYKPCGDCIV